MRVGVDDSRDDAEIDPQMSLRLCLGEALRCYDTEITSPLRGIQTIISARPFSCACLPVCPFAWNWAFPCDANARHVRESLKLETFNGDAINTSRKNLREVSTKEISGLSTVQHPMACYITKG